MECGEFNQEKKLSKTCSRARHKKHVMNNVMLRQIKKGHKVPFLCDPFLPLSSRTSHEKTATSIVKT